MTSLSPIAAARWWADVRVEALNAGVAVALVNGQTDAIQQAIREAVSRGLIAQRDADLAITELGIVSGVPRVGRAVSKMLAAFADMNGVHYSNVILTYAAGIEQELARAAGDTARAMNPTPRKSYETPPDRRLPRGTLALLAAAGILAGVGVTR